MTGPGIVPEVRPRLPWPRPGTRPVAADERAAAEAGGYSAVTVTVPLGDVTGEQLRLLADLSLGVQRRDSMRVTPDQDLVLRWVPNDAGRRPAPAAWRLRGSGCPTPERLPT